MRNVHIKIIDFQLQTSVSWRSWRRHSRTLEE